MREVSPTQKNNRFYSLFFSLSKGGCQGFTLVEIIVALGVFAMLAGAIFLSVEAVTRASGVLTIEQTRAREIDAFLQWCRRGFRMLNARSEIFLQTREQGATGYAVDLIIRKSPGAFSLGEFDARGP
ncbi:MAG: type II secretion system GspH family protein, partial [Chthoniobacterales bacterium]|nr:type II secretion system GspH family protein [Chthoniobacterales bacterium]